MVTCRAMPPRRHQQGKKKPSIKPDVSTSTPVAEDDTEAVDKFKVELQWCVQQLEAAMKKASLKEREDMAKAHRTLTSSKAQHIKKRQVMSSLFGDYRSKMTQEESKMKLEMPKIKKSSDLPTGSLFFKKSALHSSNIITETSRNSEEPVTDHKEQEVTTSIPSVSGSTSEGLTEEVNASSGEGANMAGNGACNSSLQDVQRQEKTASPFKFTHSGSTFMFNFSVS